MPDRHVAVQDLAVRADCADAHIADRYEVADMLFVTHSTAPFIGDLLDPLTGIERRSAGGRIVGHRDAHVPRTFKVLSHAVEDLHQDLADERQPLQDRGSVYRTGRGIQQGQQDPLGMLRFLYESRTANPDLQIEGIFADAQLHG